MQIHTTARHCDLDPEDKRYAEARLERLGRYARDLHEAHLVVTAEGFRHSAEITLKLKRHEMVSREESNAPRLAIELAASRLEQQLRRLKERRVSRKRAARLNGVEGPATESSEDGEAGEEEV